jgi:hypothetical protein
MCRCSDESTSSSPRRDSGSDDGSSCSPSPPRDRSRSSDRHNRSTKDSGRSTRDSGSGRSTRDGGSGRSTRDSGSSKGSGGRCKSSCGRRPHDLDLDNADEVLCLTSREWLHGSDLQAALPPRWLGFLCRFQQWAYKDRNSYESMVSKSLHNRCLDGLGKPSSAPPVP